MLKIIILRNGESCEIEIVSEILTQAKQTLSLHVSQLGTVLGVAYAYRYGKKGVALKAYIHHTQYIRPPLSFYSKFLCCNRKTWLSPLKYDFDMFRNIIHFLILAGFILYCASRYVNSSFEINERINATISSEKWIVY